MGRPRAIVVAEDDELLRLGIVAYLDTIDGVEVVAQCGSFDELMDAVDATDPGVVVTDIRMPPTHTDEGIRAARAIRDRRPGVGVVVLSQYVDPQLACDLLEDGTNARGYLLKDRVADDNRLAEAIDAVAAGGSFVDSVVVDALVRGRRGAGATPISALSPRETEVLAEMASGRSNQAIASRLFIGERAVEKHISSIFAKLDLGPAADSHRRVSAVLLFLQSMDANPSP